jgi:hypothetical protein
VKGVSYLSVHLRFGTVSIRELARAARDAGGEGADTWLSELVWRDFYFQILWHHPRVVGASFRPEYDRVAWDRDPALFAAWCEGRTGYPIVDAAMRQINHSGYMHNRLRMIVASFLTKDLGIDWREGEAYFAEHLNDFDLAANNGGWQWAASTGCDAQPYFPHLQSGDPVGALRPGRHLHPALSAGTGTGARQVHPRPVDPAAHRPEAGRLRHRHRLPGAGGGPCQGPGAHPGPVWRGQGGGQDAESAEEA